MTYIIALKSQSKVYFPDLNRAHFLYYWYIAAAYLYCMKYQMRFASSSTS